MAVLRCDFFSDSLSLSTSMTVILPERPSAPTSLPPLLYLLHGMGDDHTAWLRRTSIERYVAPLGLAVVMPQVHRSYYTDEAYGGRFWSFLSEELPALVHRLFRVSDRRKDTYVAGLSMGGYGAMKWALREPWRFRAAASLSGALNLAGTTLTRSRPEDPMLGRRLFGEATVAGSEADLVHLITEADPAALPALRLWCGRQDGLLDANHRFHRACQAAGLPVELEVGPGDHDWAYWDARIRDVLAWLQLPGTPTG